MPGRVIKLVQQRVWRRPRTGGYGLLPIYAHSARSCCTSRSVTAPQLRAASSGPPVRSRPQSVDELRCGQLGWLAHAASTVRDRGSWTTCTPSGGCHDRTSVSGLASTEKTVDAERLAEVLAAPLNQRSLWINCSGSVATSAIVTPSWSWRQSAMSQATSDWRSSTSVRSSRQF